MNEQTDAALETILPKQDKRLPLRRDYRPLISAHD